MPTVKPGDSREDFVSRCIPIVLEDGTAESQDQAVAVCSSMWRERESKAAYECECLDCGHKTKSDEHCADIVCSECGGKMRRVDRPGVGRALVMKMTKVQRLQNGRTRWQARANTGEFDLIQERFDQAFFDDVVKNFYRTQEAISRAEPPPDGMTLPILDISHYSLYLPNNQRNLARAGWPIKMWRDGRELWAQGYFDDSRLGQLAAKAALERKPEERRVSIVVYPDYSLVEMESGGRKIYRGGNGYAWMDSLCMTSEPCDPGAIMEVKMSTLAEDARTVLGEEGDEIVNELEAARTAKTVPNGALVKTEIEEEQKTEPQDEVTEPAQYATMEQVQSWLGEQIPGLAQQVKDVIAPLAEQIAELGAKTVGIEEQIKTLQTSDAQKVQKAVQDDGNIFQSYWPNESNLSVQGASESAAKGKEIKTPDELEDNKPGNIQRAWFS